jgi:hypothetical protein
MQRALFFACLIINSPAVACRFDEATFATARATAPLYGAQVRQPKLLDQSFKVVGYGEMLRLLYNPAQDAHRKAGYQVVKVKGAGSTLFVGTEFIHGSPSATDRSWAQEKEIPKLDWFKAQRAPTIPDAEIGRTVFHVVSGPFEGMELVLVQCESD